MKPTKHITTPVVKCAGQDDRDCRDRDDSDSLNADSNGVVASMSHEIRAPMNAILGFSGLLLNEPLTPSQLEKVRFIHGAGKRLLFLIDNVLDFSKLASGKLDQFSVNFDLESLIGQCMEAHVFTANEKGLLIEKDLSNSVPRFLNGDENRLRHILCNLFDNAVKFTSTGKVTIRTSLLSENEKTALIRISITDTGIGIPQDRIDDIFGSFLQLDNTLDREYMGVGLGLNICKKFTELLGGEIGVDSEPGRGSTFWINLRLKKQQKTPDLAAANSKQYLQSATASKNDKNTLRVLVVDDDRLSRSLTLDFLAEAGIQAQQASSGQSALEILAEEQYDLVLTDVQMPGIDGLETTRRLRDAEAETGRHTLVVVLSANSSPSTRQTCLEAGADDYLAKPVMPKDLMEVVRRLFGWPENDDTGEVPQPVTNTQHQPALPELSTLSMEACLQEARAALDEGSFARLRRVANHIKTTADKIGNNLMGDNAMRLEMAARSSSLARAGKAIERLQGTI